MSWKRSSPPAFRFGNDCAIIFRSLIRRQRGLDWLRRGFVRKLRKLSMNVNWWNWMEVEP